MEVVEIQEIYKNSSGVDIPENVIKTGKILFNRQQKSRALKSISHWRAKLLRCFVYREDNVPGDTDSKHFSIEQSVEAQISESIGFSYTTNFAILGKLNFLSFSFQLIMYIIMFTFLSGLWWEINKIMQSTQNYAWLIGSNRMLAAIIKIFLNYERTDYK